jgi:predicted Zn-dependent protease
VPLTRIALLVVAVITCAWLALGIRQVHDQQEAIRLIESNPYGASQAARVQGLLDGAEELNPDTLPEVNRAQLALRRADGKAAEHTLLAVVRREPDNIDAWNLLAIATAGRNPPLNRRARKRVRELAPPSRRRH